MFWIILGTLLYIGGGAATAFILRKEFVEGYVWWYKLPEVALVVAGSITWPLFIAALTVWACVWGPAYGAVRLARHVLKGNTERCEDKWREFEEWKRMREDMNDRLEELEY